jgi:RNA polymerase sigma factor (sigma-70 family)
MLARQIEPMLRYLNHAGSGGADGVLLTRFVQIRDEGAFAVLVRRHGPMVLRVCHRVLHDCHAAEDAFQATFLLLARKAGSLTQPDLVGPWLHGVAYRTARRARVQAARRRACESRALSVAAIGPDEDLILRDLRSVLDEEIDRLPQRYRQPFIVCYLQGRTNAEAARLMGCSRGTVATLLARARERLRRRLTQRGLVPTAGLLAALLAQELEAASLSCVLALSTARAATLFIAGTVSTHAAFLAKGVAKMMLVKKLSFVAAALVVVGLACGGAGLAAMRVRAREPAPPVPAPASPVVPVNPASGPTISDAPTLSEPRASVFEYASYRSANFAVTAPTREVAGQVGRAAERNRKALSLQWLDRELPTWSEPCPIVVRIKVTGAGSSTSFAFRDGQVLSRDMHVEGPLDQILADLLPHEITHTVLADWAGKALPRWADEGAALQSESDPSKARHERAVQEVLSSGRRTPLRSLFMSQKYPKEDILAFYAQSWSIVDFLVQARSRHAFLAFLRMGERDGWDRAVKSYYTYSKIEDLEQAWLAWLAEKRPPAVSSAPSQPAGTRATHPQAASKEGILRDGPKAQKGLGKATHFLPAGPSPRLALVSLDEGGGLVVQTMLVFAVPRTTMNERGQRVTYYEFTKQTQHRDYDLGAVRVFDNKGEEINIKKLPGLLKGETLALVAEDGRPVDPLHLQLIKDGTLIFVLPPHAIPAAPPVALQELAAP